MLGSWFALWQKMLDSGIRLYADALAWVMQHRVRTIVIAVGSLVAVVAALGLELRRDFFPEVDAGAFQMTVRGASGTRIEVTEQRIAQVEQLIREKLGKKNVQTIISNIGVTPDWSAAYTLNSGPMDTEINVQLTENRSRSAQEYVQLLRTAFAQRTRFTGLEFSFDAGGMIADAMNEGKPTPINIRIESNSPEKARKVAQNIQKKVERVPGVVDCRILQRLDYPEYIIDVDRQKAADLGLDQAEVMKNVVAALNSSVQFNKKNFWIDPVSHNQYYVGVQYPEADIKTVASLLDVPITSPVQKMTVPLRNIASLRRAAVPAEVTHINLAPTIDLTLGVHGRDLGHVGDDVNAIVAQFGEVRPGESGVWTPYDPDAKEKQPMEGSKLSISGEYSRMKEMFSSLGLGLVSAAVLIYFLMVALFRSYLTPLVIMSAVPIGVTGVVLVFFVTGTALDVQSLLGGDLHGGDRRFQHGPAHRLRPEHPRHRAFKPDRRHEKSGVDPRAAHRDDGPGDLLRPHPHVAGPRARKRSQRPARPGRHRRTLGRLGDDPVRRAGLVFARDPRRPRCQPGGRQGQRWRAHPANCLIDSRSSVRG